MPFSRESPIGPMTEVEFLKFEWEATLRHEFIDGFAHEMEGATIRHNRIVLNLAMAMKDTVEELGCGLALISLRLRAGEGIHYYPSIMVACDPTDNDEYVVLRPCFVAEFLMPFTVDVIYSEKLDVYRRMPSLQSILIGHQTQPRIELHTRDDAGVWTEQVLEGSGDVVLPTLEMCIPLDVIYDDVEFDVDVNSIPQPAQ